MILAHPVVAALTSYFVLSAFVDAFAKVAPVPGDSRIYVFAYSFVNALAGNVVTALKGFLTRKGDL